jgi:hypothetical protein
MARDVKAVEQLEAQRSDYTMKADYKTASGNTSITVKRSNNLVIWVFT